MGAGGDIAQLVEHRIGTPLTQVRFPGAARDFLPVNFQCRLSYGVRTPPCAISYVNIWVHVKDPVVHVRVRWITETLKRPACTVLWLAHLCRSWLSPVKATRISHGKIHWNNTVEKKVKKLETAAKRGWSNGKNTDHTKTCFVRRVKQTERTD